jgi:hypothetical protein
LLLLKRSRAKITEEYEYIPLVSRRSKTSKERKKGVTYINMDDDELQEESKAE